MTFYVVVLTSTGSFERGPYDSIEDANRKLERSRPWCERWNARAYVESRDEPDDFGDLVDQIITDPAITIPEAA